MNNRLRQQYLDAIGIQNWHLKSTTDVSGIEYDIIQESQNNNEPLDTNNAKNRFVEAPQNNQKRVSKSSHEPNVINSVPQNLLKKQPKVNGGSESLLSNKSTDLNESDGANHSSQAKITDNSNTDKKSLEIKAITNHEFENELKQSIKLCNKCQSRSTRLNALAGQGSNNASVFIVCGAPRAEEDRFGHYLVGQSETLFKAMMNSLGLEKNFYYTGLIKCYSIDNFIISEQDLSNCIPYLHSQLEQIKPSVLLILGATEAQALLNTKQSFNELRGKVHDININNKNYSVIVSYHPAFLLRNPLYKKESLKDLLMVKNLLK